MGKESSLRFSCFSCFRSATPPAAEGQTVSDEEQLGLTSASLSTETVSKNDAPSVPSTSVTCRPPALVGHHHEQVGLASTSFSTQTVSKKEQVGLPSTSSSTQTVSKKEQVGLPSTSSSTQTVSTRPIDPLAESMEKKSKCRYSRFSCFSCPGKERGTPLSAASSSTQTVSKKEVSKKELIDAIREDAKDNSLDAIIQRLCTLFEVIKTQQELQEKTQRPKESQKKTQMPTSAGFLKLKDLFLEGINGICSLKDAVPAHEAKQVVRDIVQGLGQAHWVTSCFLLVSYILDRFETLSSNREGCLRLLEQMYYLAVDIKKLTERKDLTKAGTELIVEGCLMCCTQMDPSEFRMFFTTTVNAKEISDFKEKLANFNVNMVRTMVTWICSSLLCNKVRPAVNRDDSYPEYAVGIEDSFKSVTELLRWESEERAVAVIVHGFGGIGKTTLADAVFARYFVKDCKYSVVRIDSSRDIGNSEIVKLQKIILKDLMRRTESGRESEEVKEDEILEFSRSVLGRTRIGNLLQKEAAFILIDNVVNPESLTELLVSTKLKDAKKLRLLITTRDRNVLNELGDMTSKVHEMQPLSHGHGKSLLSKKIYNWRGDNKEQITDQERERILNEIVTISGGIPKILVMIAGMMQSAENQETTFRIIKENSKDLTGDTFRHIEKAIFAYKDLPDECKSPFLDICFFLNGWKWDTVANIVGESQLEMLQKRALVCKDEDMNVRLHDIILKIGKEKAQDGGVKARDTRIDFTETPADEIQEFFEKDKKDLKLVKGLWFSDQACNIPVTKLNSMKDSLRIFGHKMVLENGQCEKRFSKLLIYKGETPHFPFKWSCLKNLTFLSYQPQNLNLLKEIPSKNLKHIELDGSLCSDHEIHSSDIQQLKTLQVLRLINFHHLEKLPEEWGTDLRENLKELTLSNCTAMKQLTGSISQLTGLQILELDNCCNLEQWPEGCESLSSSLKKIILRNCRILKSLPNCFVEALDSDSRLLFQHEKGMLLDSPQSNSESDEN